jgi:hypothetical protein
MTPPGALAATAVVLVVSALIVGLAGEGVMYADRRRRYNIAAAAIGTLAALCFIGSAWWEAL